uniref:DNA-directed RNA polymerases I, II, and III subunit RPABC1 n=1 Tax=Lygus hesperus TaxID=30085 RepID=A0A0A9WUM8_LYGHE
MKMMHEMMSSMLSTFKLTMLENPPKAPSKIDLAKFDGRNDDPKSWMLVYEKACQINNWNTDVLKVNSLLSNLAPGSTAQKWFCARMVSHNIEESNWSEWKSSFLEAFGQNRVQLAKMDY